MLRLRSIVILLLFLIISAAYAKRVVPNNTSVSIFTQSGPSLQIILPVNADPLEREVAQDCARVLQYMSGHIFTVINESKRQQSAGIYIGKTSLADDLKITDLLKDRDGFLVRPDGDRLILSGLIPEATAFAVNWFLQKYGGVRWYLPTELGEHIPKKTSWRLPIIDEVVTPDFLSRGFGGIKVEGSEVWMRRNLLRERFAFHHNIHRVIRPQDYEEHPEWFPIVNGMRYQPKGPNDSMYQPDLTYKGVVKQVAKTAAIHFEENPNAVSFSLGLNDNIRFGDTALSSALVNPTTFFRNRPDYSNYVFNFMNEAAQELSITHSEKYLGCLAYFWWENTPTFPVEPKVLPYLTADRSQWYDPAFKKEDEALIQRWTNLGPEIVGLYDYYYGWPYAVPRIFFSLEADSLKYAYKTGVQAFYAEAYPFWGLDGPKLWLAAQMLWDTDQSSEKLLNEYYVNYFQEAAKPMRRFFEKCETQWMKQSRPARWLKYYKDENQVILFPAKICIRLRRFLDDALSNAKTSIVKNRVELVSEAFRLTELLVEFHNAKIVFAQKRIDSVQDIQSLQDELIDYWSSKKKLKNHIQRLKQSQSLHQSLPYFDYLFTSDPVNRLLLSALEWANCNQQLDEVALLLLQIANNESIVEHIDNIVALQNYFKNRSLARELLINSNLEISIASGIDETALYPNKWKLKIRPAESVRISLSQNAARNSEMGLEVRGSDVSLIYQIVPVQPGKSYLFTSWQKGLVSPVSKSALTVRWQDRQSNYTDLHSTDRLPYGNLQNWTRLAVLAKAPDNVYYSYLILKINNQEPNDYVWIDDLSVLELPAQ